MRVTPLDQPLAPIGLPGNDASGMLDQVARLGAEFLESWSHATVETAAPPDGGWNAIVVAGMGGSATGGDYFAAIAAPLAQCPVVVCRESQLPAFVSPRTAVICCSHSGETEEALACYDDATRRGARLYAVRGGGELDRRARADGVPGALLVNHTPPRAALGQSLGALLRIGGVLGIETGEDVAAAAAAHARAARSLGPGTPRHESLALALARALRGRFVFVLAADHLAAGARRFANQLAENGKALAAAVVLPEAAHNLVVGLESAPTACAPLALVTLESGRQTSPGMTARFDAVVAEFERAGVPVHRLPVNGCSPLEDLLLATAWADFVSCYVGLAAGFDPTPVPAIDRIRAASGSLRRSGPWATAQPALHPTGQG